MSTVEAIAYPLLSTADGQPDIRAGDQVFLSVKLANLDPAVWTEPHAFNPDRTEQGHLASGHGPHFPGEPFPGLRLDVDLEDVTWTVRSWLNTPVSLPVAW